MSVVSSAQTAKSAATPLSYQTATPLSYQTTQASYSTASKTQSSASVNSGSIEKIFQLIDVDNSGTISVEEAGKILLKLNNKLDKHYGEDEVKAFFLALDKNNDGKLTLEEFKGAFNALTQ